MYYALLSSAALLVRSRVQMAKKVAQLTKVIYLLNTKNDEHEYEMSCLESTYVCDVLRDAQSKLSSLKSRLANKVSAELSQAVGGSEESMRRMEEMKKQHEAEKKHAVAKLEKMKEQAAQNETMLKNTAKDKIDAMRKEIEEAKTQVGRAERGSGTECIAARRCWIKHADIAVVVCSLRVSS
jgi:chromosome segregation ATPase